MKTLAHFADREQATAKPRSWPWLRTGCVAIITSALAVLSAAGQNYVYQGPSLQFPRAVKMQLTLTRVGGIYVVRGALTDGGNLPWYVNGTYTPAAGLSARLTEGNLCGTGTGAYKLITGRLVGGGLGSPASRLMITPFIGPLGQTCPPGFWYVSFDLAPPVVTPPPPPRVQLPPPPPPPPTRPATPELFTGSAGYGYTRLLVSLTFLPNGQWQGWVTVRRVVPRGYFYPPLQLPDVILQVSSVINPNVGPGVRLALSDPGITGAGSECDVTFLDPKHIYCNVVNIPSLGISSFGVGASTP